MEEGTREGGERGDEGGVGSKAEEQHFKPVQDTAYLGDDLTLLPS